MCQRGTAHLATLKSKKYRIQVDSLPKDTAEAEIETGMAGKSSLGTRQTKTQFGLEK
jgi:hypothetical protein